MAFETHLVAIGWQVGKYAVVSQCLAQMDLVRLGEERRLSDVSEGGSGYVDRAAILSREECAGYLRTQEGRDWLAALPPGVRFILVHEAEWESGL